MSEMRRGKRGSNELYDRDTNLVNCMHHNLRTAAEKEENCPFQERLLLVRPSAQFLTVTVFDYIPSFPYENLNPNPSTSLVAQWVNTACQCRSNLS